MRSPVELRHLQYFAAVVEEGTFTAAADRLRMTQPALSRAVRALETELGSALLHRRQTGVEPTAVGEVLFREAKSIDESVCAALTRARRAASGGRHLRVTARGCDVDTLVQLMEIHAGARPDAARVEPAVVDRFVQLDQIRRGDADLTLVRAPFDRRGLDSEHLRTDPRVLLVPAGHLFSGRESVDRRELAGESFPVWAGSTPAEIAWWSGTDVEDHSWRQGPVVHDGAQYLAAVRLGQAIAFLPETMLAEASLAGIRVVAVENVSGSELHLAWTQDARSPDIADFVRSAIQGRATVTDLT